MTERVTSFELAVTELAVPRAAVLALAAPALAALILISPYHPSGAERPGA